MQVDLADLVAAADALGHVVAGELDVDAPGVGPERPVDLEEAELFDLILGTDCVEGMERALAETVRDFADRRDRAQASLRELIELGVDSADYEVLVRPRVPRRRTLRGRVVA